MRYVLALCCVLAVGFSPMFSGHAWGAESDSAEAFSATEQVAEYFMALYTPGMALPHQGHLGGL
jgi:hypothetical protein